MMKFRASKWSASKVKALKQMQREDESLIESAENVNLHIKWLILEIFLLYE